jgi:hypothetical protein
MSRTLAYVFLATLCLFWITACSSRCEQAGAQHCAAKTDEELIYIYGKVEGSRDACVAEYVSEMCVKSRTEKK